MWADKVTEQNVSAYERGAIPLPTLKAKSGTPKRTPQAQGLPLNGPIQIGGRVAEQMVQVGYNAQHKIYWHWELPSYLITKGIAGGLFMLLSLGAALGVFPFDAPTFLAAGFTAMVFMLFTVILLLKDLSQPLRFMNILLRPQWKSWVARGAFVMVTFTSIAGLWWLMEGAAFMGFISADLAANLRPIVAWITLPFALGVVIYTAFLLGQAEGRDMWQSNLLPFQLLAQAIMVASGIFLALGAFVKFPADLHALLVPLFPASIALNLLLTLAGKLNSFPSDVAMLASREMTHGKFRHHYWLGGIALGHVVPLALFAFSTPLAVACAIVGLFFYEYAFVMAPQYIPNS
jgi:formate-dependent nitrite reductase membrane component NrfD